MPSWNWDSSLLRLRGKREKGGKPLSLWFPLKASPQVRESSRFEVDQLEDGVGGEKMLCWSGYWPPANTLSIPRRHRGWKMMGLESRRRSMQGIYVKHVDIVTLLETCEFSIIRE